VTVWNFRRAEKSSCSYRDSNPEPSSL